jgi:uncharacterized protein DUF4235
VEDSSPGSSRRSCSTRSGEPPDSKHRDIDWRKLLIAAAVQGAIFRAVKEASDHYSRRAFASATGSWPGEEHPKDE